eukprot:CAMPEP_0181370752 /NCGR_PEP_ID=MMETSP1106-20121128/13620_1 /TAXON_ID=81844 /ORGANISM="Mantoniella antarctica, Strain SL-175" /LENGTH=210 /DNA_ID=CAMNT_0023487619 /DNA_START=458 /DNA_END=1087 /DNA_ORIENTATION=-
MKRMSRDASRHPSEPMEAVCSSRASDMPGAHCRMMIATSAELVNSVGAPMATAADSTALKAAETQRRGEEQKRRVRGASAAQDRGQEGLRRLAHAVAHDGKEEIDCGHNPVCCARLGRDGGHCLHQRRHEGHLDGVEEAHGAGDAQKPHGGRRPRDPIGNVVEEGSSIAASSLASSGFFAALSALPLAGDTRAVLLLVDSPAAAPASSRP